MKFLIDVPVEPAALAALQEPGPFAIDVVTPPAEAARTAETEVLFCIFPPRTSPTCGR